MHGLPFQVTNITDDAIASLRTRTSLERIHLSYCDNLSVAAIHDLLSSLPRVTHLSLTGVTSFRKRALQQFCRQPPSNYNDHQRRSFCVFSGRGVHDLRRFFRALAPEELAALAVPDPPEDDDHALQQQQQQQLLFAQQQQAQQQLRLQGGAAPGPGPALAQGQGALTPAQQQLAQTQARLAQIQHARQAVALAAQRLQAHQHPHQRAGPAPGTVGGVPILPVAGGPGTGPGAGNMLGLQQLQPPVAYRPTRMPAPAPSPLPQQPNAALPGANTLLMQYAAPAPSSAAGQRSSAPPEMMSFSLAAASAAAAAAATAGAGASASTSNGAGMAAPQTPRAQTVEIEGLGEDDDGEGGEGRGQRGVRSRRDTVTRSNYRAPAGREQGDGDAMRIDGAEREGEDDEDEEDGASDSGGEEEDISMSER